MMNGCRQMVSIGSYGPVVQNGKNQIAQVSLHWGRLFFSPYSYFQYYGCFFTSIRCNFLYIPL